MARTQLIKARINEIELKRLRDHASARDLPVSHCIRVALREWLRNDPTPVATEHHADEHAPESQR